MPPRLTEQRHEENIERVRRLDDSRSPDLIRDSVVGRAVSGARRKYPLPSIGHRSGKLTVRGYIRGARGGVTAIVVQCDCSDSQYAVDCHNFRTFRSTRCPICSRKAASAKRYWAYSEAMPSDEHRTRLLNRLAAAITRCHSKTSKHFEHYGRRGITVCCEWRRDKAAFLKYIQTVSGWDDPTLEMDRIDNNAGYCPGNIRFVSKSTNLRNKRRVADLEARIRHLEQRLAEQVHDTD